MTMPTITKTTIPIDKIRDFCHQWGIKEFALFGSVLRTDFHEDSDIDVLLRFETNYSYNLSDWLEMGDDLEALFGRKVDMIDYKALAQSRNYLRRNAILKTAQVIYAR